MSTRPPEKIGSFFLDSGAHSLYARELHDECGEVVPLERRYAYFDTPQFWNYVDSYAEFVKANIDAIDHYSNVDVIHDPERTWDVQTYLEQHHGLKPVPVIHMGTSLQWLKRYLDAGHDYIGLGGVALDASRASYFQWADRMFNYICDTKDRTPRVKVHGFAMTAYSSLVRYPWYSVDSTSWAKLAAFGSVYFPNPSQRIAPNTFRLMPDDLNDLRAIRKCEPTVVSCSSQSPMSSTNKSFVHLPKRHRSILTEWLDTIEVPVGSVDAEGNMKEWGIVSHHAARKIANLRFFQRLSEALPQWSRPFSVRREMSLL